MKITILKTGDVPESLRERFSPYPEMFSRMFAEAGGDFTHDVVAVNEGEPLPAPETLEGVVITGSSAGVYEDHPWLDPLRAFIRRAYETKTPMLGICFGHQVMADALGGDVRKSEKGWGLGRHLYDVRQRPGFMAAAPEAMAVACSHQDQVIVPPAEAEVILASDFTPNAGLAYRNGAALSFQPHPEFNDDYALALTELRRGKAPDTVIETALSSFGRRSQSGEMARYIAGFFSGLSPYGSRSRTP
jgi:GMP synthase-like glutamine amidotransferase